MKPCSIQLQVDDRGRLVMPPQVTERFGLVPGAAVRAVDRGDTLAIDRSIDSLARIYVEPTTRCNMQCRTCMRNVWDEPPGAISSETLSRVLDAARRVAPHPTLFFGGLGEPFAHPEMLAMLAAAKSVGGPVEVITNGTLLDDVTCRELVRLEVERLWVSIDGATAESYADVRLWDALPQVIADLARLRELRRQSRSGLPRLGIAFVAMKRNLADLPEVIRLGQRLGADRFSVTNVLAHTDELRAQVLYARSSDARSEEPSWWAPELSIARMDLDEATIAALARVEAGHRGRSLPNRWPGTEPQRCPFVQKRSVSIRWDGSISPCLPLLHTHQAYLGFRLRTSHAFLVGNVNEVDLIEAWRDPPFAELRERLEAFDFAPCVACNSCDMADDNLEDCHGSPTPACGGCLWAQGFIQCP